MKSTLPTGLSLDKLAIILEAHGQWLVTQQPQCVQSDLATMKRTFTAVSEHVRSQLQLDLQMLIPDIPCSLAEFDPDQQLKAEYPMYWIIDALDGAVQYLSGLPLWTITLCLVVAEKPQLALVYDPIGQRMYRAIAGQGADCNGQRLQVAQRDQLELAVIGTSFPNYPQRPHTEVEDFIARIGRMIPKVFAQRWMGPASLSLSQLAAGKLDGYWETGRSLYDWLPGALIAQEAGARLTGLDGQPFGWNCQGILVASPNMYPALAGVLT